MKNDKHIILAGNTAWSMYNFRGELIKSLVDNGYKVTVVAPHDAVFTEKLQALGCNFIPVKINGKGTNPWEDFKLINQYKKLFKREKPDFAFFYTIKPNIYGSIAAHKCKVPHIAVTTGLGYTFVNSNWVSKVSKMLYKFAFKKTCQVWFLNEDDRNSFVDEKLVDLSKTFVLRGEGIDLTRFQITSLEKRNPACFLLIARMLWDKGVGEFVEAARIVKQKYPDTQFQLLGFLGVDNPSAISKEQMGAWQKEGVVDYLGTTTDVAPFINASTAVVLPSYREGIPFTLLEASASGRPIIATDTAGCRETVDDGVTGFVCGVKDAKSLADCMEKIINLPQEEYAKMALAGRKKMEKEFDVQLVVNKYLSALDECLMGS